MEQILHTLSAGKKQAVHIVNVDPTFIEIRSADIPDKEHVLIFKGMIPDLISALQHINKSLQKP